MQMSPDGEQFFRTEAEPGFAHIFSIDNVVRQPLRQGDRQKCDEPWCTLAFLHCRHSLCASSPDGTSSQEIIIRQPPPIRVLKFYRFLRLTQAPRVPAL